MTGLIITIIVVAIFVVMNIRVWRSEVIRMRSLELASMQRASHIADTEKSVISRAHLFEKYVRGGVEKPSPPQEDTS